MAFHFPLQAVFHFRQSVEHQQELRLRAANQQVARARRVVEQLDERIGQMQLRKSQELAAGTTSAELRFALTGEAALRLQRQDAERDLLRWQTLRDQQQKIFQQARRERETLESLRDHQLHDYERAAARREQRQLDDLFLLRQAYLKRG
ncbi:MAG TPA: flagellar export protein FliJ [Candidatus Sulfotelmatobacter sp.]|nr:flagellar export protein FliJ [Candidatus Sulfotelmatobacter sp.]